MLTVSEAGRKGGKARAQALSAERRREIASMGGKATAEKRILADKHKQCQPSESSENKD